MSNVFDPEIRLEGAQTGALHAGLDNFRLDGSAAVPEPATLALLGTGLIAAGVRRYGRRKK